MLVTTAVSEPVVGGVVNETVKLVAVAALTIPTAPLLNVTLLFAAVVEKLLPLMAIVGAYELRFAAFDVTTGAKTTSAT